MITYDCTPELVTAPTVEPVTLDEALMHLRGVSDDESPTVQSLLVAARQWFETALDRQLVTATWKVRYPYFPSWRIALPYPPLASVGSVQYKDTAGTLQTVSTSVYDVLTYTTPGVVQLKSGQAWPATGVFPDAVQITYNAGYGANTAVPELVKEGIKLLISHWFDHRGEVQDVPPAVQAIATAARAYRFG